MDASAVIGFMGRPVHKFFFFQIPFTFERMSEFVHVSLGRPRRLPTFLVVFHVNRIRPFDRGGSSSRVVSCVCFESLVLFWECKSMSTRNVSMTKKRGFTLIELLVVIAII